jgi:hypothetical protein
MIVTVVMNVATDPSAPRMPRFFVPESGQQQRSEWPFLNAKEIGGPFYPEDRIHPEDEGSVGKEWDQGLCLVIEPLLISEEEVEDYH